MKKLIRYKKGFLRQMQMSDTNLYVFVEGKTDRYIHSKIVEERCEIGRKNIEILLKLDGRTNRIVKLYQSRKNEQGTNKVPCDFNC